MNLENPDMLLNEMNIKSSFVIGNQSTEDAKDVVSFKNTCGVIVSRNEKGVGNNRNITLKYATADYCILADDDMKFYDDYVERVIQAFDVHPNADVLIFNIDEKEQTRRVNRKSKKIGLFNYMNYGAARIAFRRKPISYNGISFNCNFGGGTPHSSGEDSLFLRDCLLHGLNIVSVPTSLARLCDSRKSTWFVGYNEKYLFDKGVFLGIAHPKLAFIFAIYLIFRHDEYSQITKRKFKSLSIIKQGICFSKKDLKL